jgi:putative N-acetyltransferase (TIGR04045 family)
MIADQPASSPASSSGSSSSSGAPAVELACRIARTDRERRDYFALRRSIFCVEQGLFVASDRDDHDDVAYPIVCLTAPAPAPVGPRVVGVVRIWEEAPGDWWGGRLGVDAEFRTVNAVGRRLVQTAVGTARAWGAWRFRATVQRANVPFFRRLRWQTREELDVLGQPHHLMEADLGWYAPTTEVRPPAWQDRRFDGQCFDQRFDHLSLEERDAV